MSGELNIVPVHFLVRCPRVASNGPLFVSLSGQSTLQIGRLPSINSRLFGHQITSLSLVFLSTLLPSLYLSPFPCVGASSPPLHCHSQGTQPSKSHTIDSFHKDTPAKRPPEDTMVEKGGHFQDVNGSCEVETTPAAIMPLKMAATTVGGVILPPKCCAAPSRLHQRANKRAAEKEYPREGERGPEGVVVAAKHLCQST